MEVMCNADEMEAEFDVRGVSLNSESGSVVLVGSEEDVLALIGRVAELFNYELEQRDPGPDARLVRRAFGLQKEWA